MKGKSTKVISRLIVLALVIGAAFYALSSYRNRKMADEAVVTEITKLTTRDMEKDYPATVREVVNLYARISKCIYNDEMSDDDLETLVEKLRTLYDDELLEENEYIIQLSALKTERKLYKEKDRKINMYQIEDAANVVTKTIDGENYYYIKMYFTVKTGKDYDRSYENFVLRQDDDGRYKILGWTNISADEYK